MKPNLISSLFASLLALLLVSPGRSHAAALKVGDPAPKLQVSKWVQGEPVKEFERDKAYIVEFWATWCGPCRVSIPHVNALHTKFKDKGLVVIGQDVWERQISAVAPFVKKMGNQMTYRVALDTGEAEEGAMATTWMQAAGQNGIPCAFVVDKSGTIVWIGHPMKLKEEFIQQVLDGKIDAKKAAADFEQLQQKEARIEKLWRDLSQQQEAKEWAAAEASLTKIEALLPDEDRDRLGLTRFQLMIGKKDFKAAYEMAEKFSNEHPDDAMTQNELAWQIATADGITDRNLDLAEKIAQRANKASGERNAEIIDTAARVAFLKGNKAQAIDLQQKALDLVDGPRREQFEKTLTAYKEGNLPK